MLSPSLCRNTVVEAVRQGILSSRPNRTSRD